MNGPVIGVLGSCVTRQAFAFSKGVRAGALDTPDLYVARTSFVSLMSQPLPVVPELLALVQDPHERRWLVQDFDRSFWNEPALHRLDYLVIDWMDERSDLLEQATAAGPGFKLLVPELESLPDAFLRGLGFRRHWRGGLDVDSIWRSAASRFFERLGSLCPNLKLALHCAPWVREFEDGTGGDEACPAHWWTREVWRSDARRATLQGYERHLRALLPNAHVLVTSSPTHFMKRGHPWGEAPFHYVDAYNAELATQIAAWVSKG